MALKNLIANVIKSAAGYRTMEFNVAGVSFKNGRKTRQAIIRAMKFKDEPFTKECNITFERYDFEGSLAIGVYANGEQIGNVPKELISEFDKNWKSEYMTSATVLGSGQDAPYGVLVKVIFK